MSSNDHRVREYAYQIWESEGKPHGHDDRHWEMARKLADSHAATESQQSASTEPLEPLNPQEPTRPTEPVQPISPGEPAEPINPTEPIQPGEPVQPIEPVAVTPPRKSRAKAGANTPAKSLIDHNPIDPASINNTSAKKTVKPRKTKSTENESA